MSARVIDLIPGDEVTNFGTSAIFVASTQHPIWPGLSLVIWRMGDGSWSHDALDAHQVVGEVRSATHDDREVALRNALLGDGRPSHTGFDRGEE